MSKRNKRQKITAMEAEPSQILQQLMELRVPSCTTCYGEESDKVEEDEDIYLLPLPPCSCTTKLITGPLPYPLEVVSGCLTSGEKMEEIKSINKATTLSEVSSALHLSELQLKHYDNVPMCRSCLKKMIQVSSQVIELEYHDSNQNNPRFTVEAKCPHCSAKFSHRGLQRLIANERARDWKEGITNTKNVINVVKEVTSLFRRREMLDEFISKESNIIDKDINSIKNLQNSQTEETESCKNSNIDLDFLPNNIVRRKMAVQGEAFQYLLQQDPLLKQEHDDFALITKLLKSAEGRKTLGIVDPDEEAMRLKEIEEKDHKFAKMLENELNNNSKHSLSGRKSIQKQKCIEKNKFDENAYTEERDIKYKLGSKLTDESKEKIVIDIDCENNKENGFPLEKKNRNVGAENCKSGAEEIYDFVNMRFLQPYSERNLSNGPYEKNANKDLAADSFPLKFNISIPNSSTPSKNNHNHETIHSPHIPATLCDIDVNHSLSDPFTQCNGNELSGQKLPNKKNKVFLGINTSTKAENLKEHSATTSTDLQNQRNDLSEHNGVKELHHSAIPFDIPYYMHAFISGRNVNYLENHYHTKNDYFKARDFSNLAETKPVSDRDVLSLVTMGFSREEVKLCLRICDNNLTKSVSMLSSGVGFR